MRIYLVTPRNPTSFWTYDAILPTLGKRCIFPNLSMHNDTVILGSSRARGRPV